MSLSSSFRGPAGPVTDEYIHIAGTLVLAGCREVSPY
jgi:hypothetical protein